MQVKMLANISGTRDGVEWPELGGTIDLSAPPGAVFTIRIPTVGGPEAGGDQPGPEQGSPR